MNITIFFLVEILISGYQWLLVGENFCVLGKLFLFETWVLLKSEGYNKLLAIKRFHLTHQPTIQVMSCFSAGFLGNARRLIFVGEMMGRACDFFPAAWKLELELSQKWRLNAKHDALKKADHPLNYCCWLKSCTAWDLSKLVNDNGIIYLSTVWQDFFQQYRRFRSYCVKITWKVHRYTPQV